VRTRVGLFLSVGITLAAIAPPTAANAQAAPAWSRGLQRLPISVDECGRRAAAGLQAEGYNLTNRSGPSNDAYFLGAQKANHSAVIMCDSSASGGTWVNVVVFSTSDDSGVPGAERQRLQARMNGAAASQPRPPVGPPPNAVGADWRTTAMPYTRDPEHHHPPERITLTCPPGGPASANAVTGTDTYSDDSSVCQAAVHAGVISPAAGGSVTIATMVPGPNKLVGSTRYGYRSSSYDNGPNPTLGAFRFVNAPALQTRARVPTQPGPGQPAGPQPAGAPQSAGAGNATRSAHGCNGFDGSWSGPYGIMRLRNGSGSYAGLTIQGTRLAGGALSGNYSHPTTGTGTFVFYLSENRDTIGTNFTSSAGVQGNYTTMRCVGP
jgi:hypothetical protein